MGSRTGWGRAEVIWHRLEECQSGPFLLPQFPPGKTGSQTLPLPPALCPHPQALRSPLPLYGEAFRKPAGGALGDQKGKADCVKSDLLCTQQGHVALGTRGRGCGGGAQEVVLTGCT